MLLHHARNQAQSMHLNAPVQAAATAAGESLQPQRGSRTWQTRRQVPHSISAIELELELELLNALLYNG